MEVQIIELLSNGGANVAFAAFLLYQFYHQQKKLDERDSKFVEREDTLRARYDAVIQLYIDKEDKLRDSIVTDIQNIDHQLKIMENKIDECKTKIQLLGTAVSELKMRDIVRSQITPDSN